MIQAPRLPAMPLGESCSLADCAAATVALPSSELLDVYGEVNRSLSHILPVFDADEIAELDRRCEELERGEVQGVSWEELKRWSLARLAGQIGEGDERWRRQF